VSYALNGQPGVSQTTRERVLAIAKEIGWNPNGAARALTGAPTYTIGMALRRPARTLAVEPFFMELISGVEAELSARSYALTLQVVADQDAEIAVYRRWWSERRVDGVLVCDLRVDDPRIGVLQELDLHAVVIGASAGAGNLPSVWSDDHAAVVEAVGYLSTLGHTRIARVGGLPDLLHTAVRTAAFEEICANLDLAPAVTISTDYTGEEGARATRRLLSSRTRPTAILYDNDVMAIAGLSVAGEMGFVVPQDLSIIAWDDSVLCQLVHPALTAMSRDIPGYGAQAARELLEVVTGQAHSASARLPRAVQGETAHLIPRGTTAGTRTTGARAAGGRSAAGDPVPDPRAAGDPVPDPRAAGTRVAGARGAASPGGAGSPGGVTRRPTARG
jgi:DNA-binding LacI/PurR family transcriptional regulator